MTRSIGAIDDSGKFVIGARPKDRRHDGFKNENAEMQRLTHTAELQQPFNADGTVNENYTTLYRGQAKKQGLIGEDPVADFHMFE